MSRRSSDRSGVSRSTEQLFWSVVLLVLVAILHFTGLFAAILGWAGDLLLDQIDKMGSTQPK